MSEGVIEPEKSYGQTQPSSEPQLRAFRGDRDRSVNWQDEVDSISLVDIFVVVVKRRWLIISFTLICALGVTAYVFATVGMDPTSPYNLLPNTYRPTVKVLVLDRDNSGNQISPLLSSEGIGGLASVMGASRPGTNASAELAQELLRGRPIKDRIIEELQFADKYSLGENSKNSARAIIGNALAMKYTAASNVLEISYEDIDAEFATLVLAKIVDLLEDQFKAISLEKVLEKKRFLEERLGSVQNDRNQAQAAILEFQRTYGIVDIGVQSRQTMAIVFGLKQRAYDLEVQLNSFPEYLPDSNPTIVQLTNQINAIRDLMGEMKSGFQEFTGDDIPQVELPELAVKHGNLINELQVHETIYAMLRQQYETTRIEETSTSGTFQIIEPAETPEERYSPSRSQVCIFGAAAAFAFSVFLSFVLEYFERLKKDPGGSKKLDAIRLMLRRS